MNSWNFQHLNAHRWFMSCAVFVFHFQIQLRKLILCSLPQPRISASQSHRYFGIFLWTFFLVFVCECVFHCFQTKNTCVFSLWQHDSIYGDDRCVSVCAARVYFSVQHSLTYIRSSWQCLLLAHSSSRCFYLNSNLFIFVF